MASSFHRFSRLFSFYFFFGGSLSQHPRRRPQPEENGGGGGEYLEAPPNDPCRGRGSVCLPGVRALPWINGGKVGRQILYYFGSLLFNGNNIASALPNIGEKVATKTVFSGSTYEVLQYFKKRKKKRGSYGKDAIQDKYLRRMYCVIVGEKEEGKESLMTNAAFVTIEKDQGNRQVNLKRILYFSTISPSTSTCTLTVASSLRPAARQL